MTARMLIDAMERDDLPKMPLGERLIYHDLCYGADRKGTIRLSQSDLAAKYGVSRQAIVKHVESLITRRLVAHQGHGRYRVFADPWSFEAIARRYFDGLPLGGEFDVDELVRLAYGDPNDLDWDGKDPRVEEMCAYWDALEAAGTLKRDGRNGALTKARASLS